MQEPIAISEIPPLPGLQMVQQVNSALATIASDFSGPSDPAALAGPFMTWADTATGMLRRRNAAGTAWIAESALFHLGLTMYASGDIPTSDLGDIFVQGLGRHSWIGARYVPNSLPTRYRTGGTLTSASTSVTVAPGAWRAAAGDSDVILSTSMTKTLQTSGAWAAGTGNNGLFSGAAATSTWYHVHAIRNDATGAVDIGFDVSPIAANRPSGWTAYRRLGAVFNQSSGGIRPFIQTDDVFRYLVPVNNLNNSALPDTSLTVATVSAPLGVRTRAYLGLTLTAQSAAAFGFVFSPGDTDRSVLAYANVASSPSTVGTGSIFVMTDTNAQVNSRGAGSIPSGFYLSTNGYTDFIGD